MSFYLTDSNISLEAKGLLSLALTLKENNETISLELFKKNCSDSTQIISKVLKELALYGYMTRIKNSNGRLYYEYSFYNKSLINKYIQYYTEEAGVIELPKEQLIKVLPNEYFEELWFEVE